MTRLMSGALRSLLVFLALSGCDDGPPASVDSGFRLTEDAFAFTNFTGDGRLEMNGDLAARMFGADAVCIDGALPCTPTGAALGWIETVNEHLAEGRSEGMAILALLLRRGDLDAEEFGGSSASELRLDGNPELQAELAYWAATQYVAGVVNHRRFDATDVIPFLAEALAPDATERYRLAIAVREDDGSYAHGHALVPIGYYADESRGGVYWLRVYDGNVPNRELLLEIDSKNGTWRYEVPAGEGTLVYEGTPANDNPLTFAPVSERLGVLPAPFAEDSPHLLLTHSSEVGVTVEVGDETAGVNNGEIDEGAGIVTPLFSACASCSSRGFFVYDMRDKAEGERDMSLTISGASGRSSATGSASISVHQPGRTTSVSGIDGSATGVDTFSVTESGDVTYTNRSGTDLYLRSGGGRDRVTLATDGPTDEVRISRDSDGTVTLDVEGAPAGTTVSVSVGTGSDRIRYEYMSTGMDQRVSVNPTTGEVQVDDMVFDGFCTNGRQNSDETDVDCGGSSCDARCELGKFCRVTADCVSGAICPQAGPRICASPGCGDGILNGDETEIDCGGGTCSPCVATFDDSPACDSGSDCDTGRCTAGTCQPNTLVYVNVRGLRYGTAVTLDATFDGVTTERTLTSTSNFGASTFNLGGTYEYALAVGSLPPQVSSCTFRSTPEGSATGYSVSYDLDCTQDAAVLVLDVRELPAGSVFELRRDLDGTVDMVSVNALGTTPLGAFRTSAELEVVRQPDPVMTADGLREVACDFHYWDTTSVVTTRTLSYDGRSPELYARIECLVTETPASMDGGVSDGGTTDGGTDMGIDAGPPSCTFDSDCANADCYCGASSGNCAGATGQCGAGKAVIHVPTTDGVAASGTFTVPSACSQVHVQAWGAAGGNSGSEDPFSFNFVFQRRGGAGGYVTGELSAASGDVFTAWIGQGGAWNNNALSGGTASVGSDLGTAASGGASSSNEDFLDFNAGASGGGLTSVQQTGSTTRSFVIPAGGGAGFAEEGQDTGSAGAGTGSMTAGADGTVAESQGGGGAGDPGGISGPAFGGAGQAGGYGALPTGLTSMDGAFGDPANTTAPDRSLCLGLRSGDPAAGSSSISFEEGGDGCVVFRCVPE